MKDLEILNNFKKEYLKNNSVDDLKSKILSYLKNEISDSYVEYDITENFRNYKNEAEKEFILLGFNGVLNALLVNMCSSEDETYNKIKKDLINKIENDDIRSIEKMIKYEIKFYNKIKDKKLIDYLINCYVYSNANKKSNNEKIEYKLHLYYGDVSSRMENAFDYINNSEYRNLF